MDLSASKLCSWLGWGWGDTTPVVVSERKKKENRKRKKKERKRKENLSYPMKAQSWESSLGKHAGSKKECKQPLKVTGNVC